MEKSSIPSAILLAAILIAGLPGAFAGVASAAMERSLSGSSDSGRTAAGGPPGAPAVRQAGPRAFHAWACPGILADVTISGVERWSPGLFLSAGAVFFRRFGVSVRPALLYENGAPALRAAATFDLFPPGGRPGVDGLRRGSGAKGGGIEAGVFAGGGVAWHRFGEYRWEPLVCGGFDIGMTKRLVLTGGGNLLFEKGDTDLEVFAALGIRVR